MTRTGITVEVIDHARPEHSDDAWWDPTVTVHTAVIRDGDDTAGSVGVVVRPRDSVDFWTMLRMDEGDAGWLVEIERPEIRREYIGHRYGLRLVTETIAHFSRGRTCLVTLIAEPRNWESLKERDRLPALVALDRHWSQLGFETREVRADDVKPRLMRLIARDYTPPAINVIPRTW